ncbi:unnamed protein product [Acanthoscelides obtectus]|uniref:DUF4371 domain-containing protein n=1 Tax=Acanthoscelides obtectus TaxID=200917 RepID=A0A9P0JLB3_ACAOB|nr:unnamed protein product [Acanthoscelides obtectus]CAK1673803.1 hypothetical protein AOBTE_LOCUS29441 [Acanthoscelides obtectus]
MTQEVLNILKNLDIPIEKCYGQGYDGASVMSGAYNGVNAQIKRVQQNAEYVNFSSKVLQKKNIDLSESVSVLEQVEKNLTELRFSSEILMIEATELANKWNIQPEFRQKRQPKVKKHFDELLSDYRFNNTQILFKINVFNVVMDRVLTQISNRFRSMKKINKLFDLLLPKIILSCDETSI